MPAANSRTARRPRSTRNRWPSEYKSGTAARPGLSMIPWTIRCAGNLATCQFAHPGGGDEENRTRQRRRPRPVPEPARWSSFLTTGAADQETAKAVEMLTMDRPDLIEGIPAGRRGPDDRLLARSFRSTAATERGYPVLNAIVETVGLPGTLGAVDAVRRMAKVPCRRTRQSTRRRNRRRGLTGRTPGSRTPRATTWCSSTRKSWPDTTPAARTPTATTARSPTDPAARHRTASGG